MTLNLLDEIGNWNSQLFRELKGRLKLGNMAIASALSICGQLLLFLSFRAQIPVAPSAGQYTYPFHHKFCTEIDKVNYSVKCVKDAAGNFTINWQYWWLELFVYLSIFSAIVLLVAGTYMLVSDLDKEERRGTLNFIRLSPQSANTIFVGKILGVPILLYLAGIIAVPLHLYSGLTAQIPLPDILCFYFAMAVSCALFYSAAMLFGLTTSWLGGFQAWLASAAVLFFITVAFNMPSEYNAADLVTFLSPAAVLKYSVDRIIDNSNSELYWLIRSFDNVKWFGLPVGATQALCTGLSFLACASGTYWMWQGWQRRFPNPSSTVLSKRLSYLLTISSQPLIIGFAIQSHNISGDTDIRFLSALNLVLFLGLIAALTPERQALYDWARYRKQLPAVRSYRRYPMLDFIWSEKSPAEVAIALNIFISLLMLAPWMPIKDLGLFALFLINFVLIYATITQLFLFAKIRNQAIWAVCTVGGIILLPPMVLSMLSLHVEKAPWIWLLSVFPTFGSWQALSYVPGYVSATSLFLPVLGQWTVLVLLNLKLTRQLRIAGESATKALLKA